MTHLLYFFIADALIAGLIVIAIAFYIDNGDGGIVWSSGFIAINSVYLTIASVPIVGRLRLIVVVGLSVIGGWSRAPPLRV